MSAEYLRETARMIRETAQAATPGPWVRSGSSIETDHECSPGHDCWPVGDTYSGMKPDGSTYPRDLNRSDAEHIASWHPAVALAVADWLDDEAGKSEWINEAGRRVFPVNPRALAVARAWQR